MIDQKQVVREFKKKKQDKKNGRRNKEKFAKHQVYTKCKGGLSFFGCKKKNYMCVDVDVYHAHQIT